MAGLRTPLTSTAGSFMKSREAQLRDLVRDWLRKADLDCDVAARLVSEGDRFRDIVAFHCQQAVEKYLKSILVQVELERRRTLSGSDTSFAAWILPSRKGWPARSG